MSTEEWNIFLRRWEVFKTGSGIDEASAPSQLFQCAGADLGDRLLKTNPRITSEALSAPSAAMRSLAVIPVATCVLRTELLQLHQERDEAFRAFAARVRGKAETCAFNARCECGKSVNYTDHVIRDVLLNGLSDSDIRKDVLGTKDILTKPINDVIAFVETKEMARNALPSATLSSISTFKQIAQAQPKPHPESKPHQTGTGFLPAQTARLASRYSPKAPRGWNTKPHKVSSTATQHIVGMSVSAPRPRPPRPTFRLSSPTLSLRSQPSKPRKPCPIMEIVTAPHQHMDPSVGH